MAIPVVFYAGFTLNRLELQKFGQAFLSQESSLSWPSEHKLAKHVVLLTYLELLHIISLFIVFASWQAPAEVLVYPYDTSDFRVS